MNVSAIASTLLSSPVSASSGASKDPAAIAANAAAQRHKVAGQFEAILVRQMLSKSVGSMMGNGDAASSVYGDMMTDVLAQNLTAGPGLGLGRMLEQELTPQPSHAAAAAKSTAAAAKPAVSALSHS
jgi:flagellar protein FlgJ